METEAVTTTTTEAEITMGKTTDLLTHKTITIIITMEAVVVGTRTTILLPLLPFLLDGNLRLLDLAMDPPHLHQAIILTVKDHHPQDHLVTRKAEEDMATAEAAAVIEDRTHIEAVVILIVVDVKGGFSRASRIGEGRNGALILREKGRICVN